MSLSGRTTRDYTSLSSRGREDGYPNSEKRQAAHATTHEERPSCWLHTELPHNVLMIFIYWGHIHVLAQSFANRCPEKAKRNARATLCLGVSTSPRPRQGSYVLVVTRVGSLSVVRDDFSLPGLRSFLVPGLCVAGRRIRMAVGVLRPVGWQRVAESRRPQHDRQYSCSTLSQTGGLRFVSLLLLDIEY